MKMPLPDSAPTATHELFRGLGHFRSLLLAVGVVVLLSAHGHAAPRQALPGHQPKALRGLTATGRPAATKRLQVSIGLPLRNTEELEKVLAGLYSSPANDSYHRWLTPEQFAERFGPTEADYQAVMAFARANGLTVAGTHPNRMLVDIEAPVGAIEKAFHVTLRSYQHPKEQRMFFAPDTEPSVEMATPLLHISGLDNLVIPRPLSHQRTAASPAAEGSPQAGSGPGGTYVGSNFRNAYVPGVSLTGTGQSVALVQFGGYYASDITQYETSYGLPNVPLNYVLLNGITSISYNAVSEAALDIEMAISMAPGLSQVITYLGSSTNTILNRIATDNVAKQISASWTYDYDNNTLQIWKQLAAQGQAFFNASGDSDAYPGTPDTPTDVPYITIVGGTTLSMNGAATSWSAETVWNWGNGIGSGGGISTTYGMPVWQQGISMSANHGSTTMRNLPDVAMCADNVRVIYN